MGSDSRYDRYRRPVSAEEFEEAQALHAVARLLREQPHELVPPELRPALSAVLDMAGIELNAGREVPRPVRLAIRRFARELLRQLRGVADAAQADQPAPH